VPIGTVGHSVVPFLLKIHANSDIY
jgi:hypothetical protein